MRLSVLALGLLLVSNADSSASQVPQRQFPYASLNAPPEAVTAAGGGPAVAAVEKLKATVVLSGGGPCGGPDGNYSSSPESAIRRDPSSAETTPYLGFYIAGGAIGLVAMAFAGWWLLRRRGA